MADVKISQLPLAVSINSSDQFEVEQSGTSRRASYSQIFGAGLAATLGAVTMTAALTFTGTALGSASARWAGGTSTGPYINAPTGETVRIGVNNVDKVTISATLATFAGNLVVSGTGPHAIGGATDSSYLLRIGSGATFTTGGTHAFGFAIDSATTIAPAVNGDGVTMHLSGTINKAGSGTHSDFATLRLSPYNLGAGGATLTTGSTLKITGQPTGATNNYGLWNLGTTRLDNTLSVNGQIQISFGALALSAVTNAAATTNTVQVWHTATSGDNKFVEFYTEGGGGTFRGAIDYNRAGNLVRYNTSSDQRLKVDRGVAIKPLYLPHLIVHDFDWKATGNRSRGVFAQEAHKVFPDAISVGSDGDDLSKPWAASYSAYVPDLIVGWQDHERRLAVLETRLN